MEYYKIIFFKGPLITLNYFIDQMINNAVRNKIEYLIADSQKPETYSASRLLSFIRNSSEKQTVMLTMNQIGINYFVDGVNFWRRYDIKVYDFIQDHPRNYDDILLNPPCDISVFALDYGHIDFIRRFYDKIENVYFVPNGGTEIGDIKPFDERSIDVLYMGGCQEKVNNYPSISGLPNAGSDLYQEVIRNMIDNPCLTTEEAVENYFLDHRYSISENDILKLHLSIDPYIENAVRRYFKLIGVQALDKAGVHVDIYGGDSWLDHDYSFSNNIKIHPWIPIEQMINVINNAKISLCFIPWYKRGCSEKNFDSMLNGALCVSDRSKYLNLHYRDGENIIFFDLKNPDQMAADVKWLLEHTDKAEQIAGNGHNTAKKYDTWDNRSDMIFGIISQEVECNKEMQSVRHGDGSSVL